MQYPSAENEFPECFAKGHEQARWLFALGWHTAPTNRH